MIASEWWDWMIKRYPFGIFGGDWGWIDSLMGQYLDLVLSMDRGIRGLGDLRVGSREVEKTGSREVGKSGEESRVDISFFCCVYHISVVYGFFTFYRAGSFCPKSVVGHFIVFQGFQVLCTLWPFNIHPGLINRPF